KKVWFWDIIDQRTRFLLASHMSTSRGAHDARVVMTKAAQRAQKAPKVVITDKLSSYLDGIELTFGREAKHIAAKGLTASPNTNLIERFHGSLKARTKVMRGLKKRMTANLVMNGWLVHYNFFRTHEALNNRTPAEKALTRFPYRNWLDVVTGGRK
ncbi:MAG: DDE-type integrase/transposase/recombinase, partial [Chloroflexota bacterium]